MILRPLGRTGLYVTEICLGALTFVPNGDGHPTATGDERVYGGILDAYLEAGGNFIDTADTYG